MFIVAQDRTQNTSAEVQQIEFQTVQRHRPAKFTIRSNILNSVSIVTNGIARVLAIRVEYLTFIGTDPSLLSRRLATGEQVFEYTYQMSFGDDEDDAPLDVAMSMRLLTPELVSNIPGYD